MQDLEKKVSFLTWYVETVWAVTSSIADDHLARLYGRALPVAVDSFLKLARALNNDLFRRGCSTPAQRDLVKERIQVLQRSFDGCYEAVRDRHGAHVQAEMRTLPTGQEVYATDVILDTWNEVDLTSLTIIKDDVVTVWRAIEPFVPGGAMERPKRLATPASLAVPSRIVSEYFDISGMVSTADRLGGSRRNTAMLVPNGEFQEKVTRVVTVFDGMRQLSVSGLIGFTCRLSILSKKATKNLLVLDLCSAIDNIFEDRPPTDGRPADRSLITIWREKSIRGTDLMSAFPRDPKLERRLRRARNKYSAHLDGVVAFADLESEFEALSFRDIQAYASALTGRFFAATRMDMATSFANVHGHRVPGISGGEHSGHYRAFHQ